MRRFDGSDVVGWLVAIAVACGLLGVLLQLVRYGSLIEFCCATRPVP